MQRLRWNYTLRNRKKFGQFFGRFRIETNKLTIESTCKSHTTSSTDEDDYGTMMDKIYKCVSCTPNISFGEMNGFRSYIDYKEYDTDTSFNDIENYDITHSNSNILSSKDHLSATFCSIIIIIKY